MVRINYVQQALHLVIFLLLQIPFLYKLILFDVAFGFFYIGFVLFLPYGLNRSLAMLIAFAGGLIVDVFSNTPGMHASASILVAFAKDSWFGLTVGSSDDDVYLDWNELGVWGSVKYLLPLIFVHHFIIFTVENGGFNSFGFLLAKISYSALYSFTIVFGLSFLMAPKVRRI
ncbi:hypothetical protein [Marinoscillum furvescens]|uniref:Rod shape-determining protein MreD n=1 Tax=Marinoscillum furvescens DSM 4134 TaxID=1122208 RepID=A0A3D9L8U0_MARFU|nr:hypothetical protein [Marinoscillum furvescens]REE01696.1 hypothetical protein C7460_103213 [Marinoscillum furvescens DSM 4134]